MLVYELYVIHVSINRADHALVLKELDMKRTQLVWESNKLSEAESKLYHSEQLNARKKEELTRLRIRLQETMEKLNQGNVHGVCNLEDLCRHKLHNFGKRRSDCKHLFQMKSGSHTL